MAFSASGQAAQFAALLVRRAADAADWGEGGGCVTPGVSEVGIRGAARAFGEEGGHSCGSSRLRCAMHAVEYTGHSSDQDGDGRPAQLRLNWAQYSIQYTAPLGPVVGT